MNTKIKTTISLATTMGCFALAATSASAATISSLSFDVDPSSTSIDTTAANVVDWTRKQLDEEQMAFLANLKYVDSVETFTIVHSTLDAPSSWGYVFDKLEAEANFNYQVTSVCFYGHTHVPMAFEKSDTIRVGLYKKIKISVGKKYFINVGSVGQPRDGDPRSAYVIYDLIENSVELRRIPYDLERTQSKIIEQGLPERLANRLAIGR